jgi:hypothetical protein
MTTEQHRIQFGTADPTGEEYRPIEIDGNWCCIDQLDGKHLEDGQVLQLKWPNGDVTIETIHLHKDTVEYSDHGKPSDYPRHRAVVHISVHGLTALVFIRENGVLVKKAKGVFLPVLEVSKPVASSQK